MACLLLVTALRQHADVGLQLHDLLLLALALSPSHVRRLLAWRGLVRPQGLAMAVLECCVFLWVGTRAQA